MTDEAAIVLRAIHEELRAQDPEVVGPIAPTADALFVLDGRLRLGVVVHSDPDAHPAVAHCHVLSDVGLGEHSARLDACVVGIHEGRRESLAAAGRTWVSAAAGPILSLLHARPVMGAAHFDGSEPWGVSGCHGFVGPIIVRAAEKPFAAERLQDASLFDYAAEMAPPGVVHLVKVTLEAAGDRGWNRTVEVDGHAATHTDTPWDVAVAAPSHGVASQFAVFHYGDRPRHVEERRRLDDAIRRFVVEYAKAKDMDGAAGALRAQGVDEHLVRGIEDFLALAFGRVVFGSLGPTFSPVFTRVKGDGSIAEGLPLMHQPAFARSLTICRELIMSERLDAVKGISLTSPEVDAINNALHAGSRPENLKLLPSVIPEAGADPAAIQRAIERLGCRSRATAPVASHVKPAKPWWRFW